MRERFGPSPYGHEPSDVFIDPTAGTINYEYFKKYLDRAALPVELARECIGDAYWPTPPGANRGERLDAASFIRLSTLQECDSLPPFREVKDELVPYPDICDFTVAGPLSIWGGDNLLATTQCVFVSHRWLSPAHPDPSAVHFQDLKQRFCDSNGWQADGEVYLWIDFCCLPQRHGSIPLTHAEQELVRVALKQLTELVKSCELLILHSSDYLTRAWCYAELFVWLCKIAEMRRSGVTMLDSRLVRAEYRATGREDAMVEFLSARGFGGAPDDLVELLDVVEDYYSAALDSANYTLGSYGHEYVPDLIAFTC
jgi:hypothetical protein